MTRLEDLIRSLASVIIRYHSTQIGYQNGMTPSDELDSTLPRTSTIDIIETKLTKLIETGTKTYNNRKHFLTFLLHEILFLKTYLDRKTPFTSEELERFQQQITQLIIDCRQLLNTQKDKLYKVSYSSLDKNKSSVRVDLNGSINNAYIGNHFCNSGILLRDLVLVKFNMNPYSSDEQIGEFASSLCSEHQHILLNSELSAENLLLKSEESILKLKISELEHEKSTLEIQRFALNTHKISNSIQICELEKKNAILETDKCKLMDDAFMMTQKNQTQEQIIEKLRDDLVEAQKKLEKTQLELNNIQKREQKQTQEQAQQTEETEEALQPETHRHFYSSLYPFMLFGQQKKKGAVIQPTMSTEQKIEDKARLG